MASRGTSIQSVIQLDLNDLGLNVSLEIECHKSIDIKSIDTYCNKSYNFVKFIVSGGTPTLASAAYVLKRDSANDITITQMFITLAIMLEVY